MNILAVIIIILFGLVFSTFATENASKVVLTVFSLGYEMPLYMVIIGSFLFGLVTSWVMSLGSSVSSTINMIGKDKEIKETNKAVADLTDKINELEKENAALKSKAQNNHQKEHNHEIKIHNNES